MNKASLLAAAALVLCACATSTPPIIAPGLDAPAVADTPIKSQSGEYDVDPRHTSIVWKVQHLGLALFTARFDRSAGVLDLDAQSPTRSKLTFTIDAHSVSTNLPQGQKEKFDEAIARGIGADKTPEIKFISTNLVRTGPQSGRITGDLTMNGVTKPATFLIVLRGEGSNPLFGAGIGIEAKTTLKRSDWGVDYARAFAGDDVIVEVDCELDRKS